MTVLYPTGGLGLGLVQNPEWACVLARAYNSWIADRFTTQSPRLQAVALLPVHEPLEAAEESSSGQSRYGWSPGCCRPLPGCTKATGTLTLIRFMKRRKGSTCR